MQNLTNPKTDLSKELQELKQEISALKTRDRNQRLQIDNLKQQVQAHQNGTTNTEVKYQSLFDNVPIAVFRTNAQNGKIIYSNREVWSIIGCEPQEDASALNFYANPEDRADLIRDLKESGKVIDREIQVRKPDGSTIWVTLSAVYYDSENAIEGVMMDITRIKDSILELQKSTMNLIISYIMLPMTYVLHCVQ